MASSNVVVKDLGWLAIRRNMRELDRMSVDVGVQADAGTGEDGVMIAQYGAWNEFGTENGHIPERSFMRATFDDNVGKLMQTVLRLRDLVLRGRIDAMDAGGILGEMHQGQIQQRISSGIPPENAPSTIRQKGSSKPLIDQGALRQAIRYEVRLKAPWWRFW